MIACIWGTRAVKFIGTESRIVTAKCYREGEGIGELLFSRYRVLVLQDGKSSVEGQWWWLPNSVDVLDAPEPIHLKMGLMVNVMLMYFSTVYKTYHLSLLLQQVFSCTVLARIWGHGHPWPLLGGSLIPYSYSIDTEGERGTLGFPTKPLRISPGLVEVMSPHYFLPMWPLLTAGWGLG